METVLKEETAYSKKVIYLLGLGPRKERIVYSYGPFKKQEDLLWAVRDHENDLDRQYKFDWSREE